MALKLKYSPLQRLTIDNIYNSFMGLGPQERVVAAVVAGLMLLLLLILPIWMTASKIRSMEKLISGSQGDQIKILEKIQELKGLEGQAKALESQLGPSSSSLTSSVESLANRAGIGSNIQAMKERPATEGDILEERGVELTLKGVTLEQLVSFLYEVENNPQMVMRVRKIKVEPHYRARSLLNVSCELMNYSVRREEEG